MYLLKLDGYQWNGKELSKSYFIKTRREAKKIIGKYVNPYYPVIYSVTKYRPFAKARYFTVLKRGAGREF